MTPEAVLRWALELEQGCMRRSLLFKVVVAVLIDLGGFGRSSIGLCLLQKNHKNQFQLLSHCPFVGVSTVAEAWLGSCSPWLSQARIPVLLLENELTVCSQQIPDCSCLKVSGLSGANLIADPLSRSLQHVGMLVFIFLCRFLPL